MLVVIICCVFLCTMDSFETYIRLMRLVLSGLSNVSFYFDNIFVYGTSWKEHMDSLAAVLSRLKEYNLTVRPSKCKIGFPSIKYLGFSIDGTYLMPQYNKVEALLGIKPPTSKKLLRSFLGIISFYRKFIPNASSLTSSLSDLLRKGVKEPLLWTSDHQDKFDKLKSSLSTRPILKLPDISQPFVLRTDASGTGLGAVLLQYQDGSPFPVAYASRKLLDRETRYSTIERECLAMIFGIKKFNYYLMGKEFILETDHKPLVYLNNVKTSNDRLLRWSLNLQSYRYRIVYIAGKDNIGADFLSRTL